jgi:galactonate dehydratase
MKITRVETVLIDRYLFVRVHTDAGLVGLGESGAWGFLEASEAAIEKFARYLVGQDPLRIEHHWNYLYRAFFFRGAAIMGALSAIDIALWDLKGKHLGVPVYELLGGKTRDRARVYLDIGGGTVEAVIAAGRAARERGFTAVGHLSPLVDGGRGDVYFKTHGAKMHDAVDAVRRYREELGPELDLCIELHRRLTPAEAIALGRALEPYHPMFYEDPLRPDNLDAMALVASRIGIPIATGERLHTIHEFEMLLRRDAVGFVRPSLGLCGGISGAKKIAALAEAHHVMVAPHLNSSPVITAANVQLAACIPNFAIMEYGGNEDRPPKSEIVRHPIAYDGQGFLVVPDAAGLGIELADGAAERHPYRPREIENRLHVDGSTVDF